MSDPFTRIYEITDTEGNKHRVYPMKIRDKDKVVRLVEKFNDTIVFTNFMIPKFNSDASIARDEEGNLIYDNTAYNALMELAQLATKQSEEELLEWLDVYTLEDLIAMYLNISQLKKKVNPIINL